MDLIGCLESHDQYGIEADQQKASVPVLKLLEGFTKDQDPRVRSSAFQAMVGCVRKFFPSDQEVFKRKHFLECMLSRSSGNLIRISLEIIIY